MYQRLGDLFFAQRLGSFEDDTSTSAVPNGTSKPRGKAYGKYRTRSSIKKLQHLQKKINKLSSYRNHLTKIRNDASTSDVNKSKIDKKLMEIATKLDKLNAASAKASQALADENKKLIGPSVPPVQINKDQIIITPPAAAPATLQGFGATSGSSLLYVAMVGALAGGAFYLYKKHKAVAARKRRKNRRKR